MNELFAWLKSQPNGKSLLGKTSIGWNFEKVSHEPEVLVRPWSRLRCLTRPTFYHISCRFLWLLFAWAQFLISKNGEVLGRYFSTTTPDKIEGDIEKALAE